jgi:C4-dicarboxylate transporter
MYCIYDRATFSILQQVSISARAAIAVAASPFQIMIKYTQIEYLSYSNNSYNKYITKGQFDVDFDQTSNIIAMIFSISTHTWSVTYDIVFNSAYDSPNITKRIVNLETLDDESFITAWMHNNTVVYKLWLLQSLYYTLVAL